MMYVVHISHSYPGYPYLPGIDFLVFSTFLAIFHTSPRALAAVLVLFVPQCLLPLW